MGNGVSLCCFAFLEGEVGQAVTKSHFIFGEIFSLSCRSSNSPSLVQIICHYVESYCLGDQEGRWSVGEKLVHM